MCDYSLFIPEIGIKASTSPPLGIKSVDEERLCQVHDSTAAVSGLSSLECS